MARIKIVNVDEITTTNGTHFTAFKAVTKQGKKIDCRFTKAVDPAKIPDQPCYINVPDDKANVDTHREYPVLWVKEITNIELFESRNNLADFFED